MLRFHAKVRIHGIRPELVLALCVAHELYREHGESLTITAVINGPHMRASLHYTGAAADLRLPRRHPTMIARELAKRLGSDYDVVLEKTHIHVEFQPKVSYRDNAGRATGRATNPTP